MGTLQNLIGTKVNKLCILSFSHVKGERSYFNCKCDCGKEKVIAGSNIKSGHTTSCGCENRRRIAASITTHGLAKHPLYKTWNNITQRTGKHKNYLGLTVCPEWLDFKNFFDWCMENGWQKGLSIERISNNIGYCPANCKWILPKEQHLNKSTTRYIEYKGEIKPLITWLEELDLNRSTIVKRLNKGMNPTDAFEMPVNKHYSRRK